MRIVKIRGFRRKHRKITVEVSRQTLSQWLDILAEAEEVSYYYTDYYHEKPLFEALQERIQNTLSTPMDTYTIILKDAEVGGLFGYLCAATNIDTEDYPMKLTEDEVEALFVEADTLFHEINPWIRQAIKKRIEEGDEIYKELYKDIYEETLKDK